jgi:hypothetical protein
MTDMRQGKANVHNDGDDNNMFLPSICLSSGAHAWRLLHKNIGLCDATHVVGLPSNYPSTCASYRNLKQINTIQSVVAVKQVAD